MVEVTLWSPLRGLSQNPRNFPFQILDRAVSGGGDASLPNLHLQEKHIQPQKQTGPVGMIEERKMDQRRQVELVDPSTYVTMEHPS